MNPKIINHGGNITSESQRLGINIDKIIDASASLAPFPLPEHINRTLQKALTNQHLKNYPDCNYQELKEAISHWHGLHHSNVLPGNGAAELFTWAARDASKLGLNGLPAPGFSDYERALNCWDASFIHFAIPLKWKNKWPQTFPIKPSTNVIWITNPHNPTGQLWSKKSIESLLCNYSLVICDEAFLSLVPNGEKESVIPLIAKHKNLIVIRSLTKLFGIAGLRLGYAISSPERLRRWQEYRDPWPVNGFALAAGISIMKNHSSLSEWMSTIHNWISEEGDWLYNNLQKITSINPHPSSANFLLIESKNSLLQVREKLARQSILVRDCRSFINLGENWLRISLQTKNKNYQLIRSLKNILK